MLVMSQSASVSEFPLLCSLPDQYYPFWIALLLSLRFEMCFGAASQITLGCTLHLFEGQHHCSQAFHCSVNSTYLLNVCERTEWKCHFVNNAMLFIGQHSALTPLLLN